MSLFIKKTAMDAFLERQIANCHGYSGNKKQVYKEALLAVKSFVKTENCIGVETVMHGHWISTPGFDRCPVCQMLELGQTKYCPHCGAKMDEETDND